MYLSMNPWMRDDERNYVNYMYILMVVSSRYTLTNMERTKTQG